ncbi:hypothetical protein BLNAU_3094 [Blattamonas nauphoetae]|uniref:Uncharacterized protein n=1 Tax=Blattamonas nauphoetae TaxID=2049346 RepID=A0ABQ9YE56_9EUKA|nr:hypothetical protein BLNAU_3094 [Blattamonas nauphoetae]
MNLISQSLQHTATFLNTHPDLIDSFLETVDLSKIHFQDDQHLNLISTLSESSSPLFTKLSEPLLDPTFPLDSVLSLRSFTDPASSFFRMAGTCPEFFHRLVVSHAEHIFNIALWSALWTVRVVSDNPSEPHCLDFGRATPNWVVLLTSLGEVKLDLIQHGQSLNLLPFYLLTFLVLSAASINNEMSTAAVSVFSNQFGLSTPHTEALLFATPTTFPVSDAFTSQPSQEFEYSDHNEAPCQSICAEAGRCIMWQSRSDVTFANTHLDCARMIGIPFAACLVNALHSTTTLPHSFPFFSPELCLSSQKPSVWNDSNRPSALLPLTTLADIAVRLEYGFNRWVLDLSHLYVERRDTACVHLFPFLGPESQWQFLSMPNWFVRSTKNPVHSSLDRIVECLVEMATVNSYNTPIALLAEMKNVTDLLSFSNPETSQDKHTTAPVLPFEKSITEKLRTAEGEERWRFVTQLAVVSGGDPGFVDELMKAENDAQALFMLSIHFVRCTPRLDFHLDTHLAAFDSVIELAGCRHNLPLVSAALAHIADCVGRLDPPSLAHTVFDIDQNQKLSGLVSSTLCFVAARRREGVDEGYDYESYLLMSQIVDSCLKVFGVLMSVDSFDPTPFIDSLVSLAVTPDLALLRSILLTLQQIEEQTRNTPTPFSISTATVPFGGDDQSSVTQHPLTSILSSILLSASLDLPECLVPPLVIPDSDDIDQTPSQTANTITPSQVLQGLNENLIVDITKGTAESLCLILEENRENLSRCLAPGDPLVLSLNRKGIQRTPQQLFLALHKMVLTRSQAWISASTLFSLAPFLTRILTVVVPSSPDRTILPSNCDEHSLLVYVFLCLFQSLILSAQTTTLSTPPLSSLLSVLSMALVRLDLIPSDLYILKTICRMFTKKRNRSNPQMKQVVLALSEEGMADRSEIARTNFSLVFLNKWKGANTKNLISRSSIDYTFDQLNNFALPTALQIYGNVSYESHWPFEDLTIDELDHDESDDVL